MDAHLLSRRKRLKHCHDNDRSYGRQKKKPIFRQMSGNIQLSDLPLDVLGTILSKLPPKETYRGKVVEELEVKFEFDATLAEHLNDWVSFALSARAKNLALDLLPDKWGLRADRYRFPIELFEGENISRIQHLQLSFVSFESPSWFNGFPNLKKLDLHVFSVTRKDLQDMLSNCFNLEWLSIVRCHLNGEQLRVLRPLPHLLYLHVAYCDISGIAFIAMNLQTFVYDGIPIPFYLGPALALKDARLYLNGNIPLKFALIGLPNLFPSAQNLILHSSLPLETPWLQGNNAKFSLLKYLRLEFLVMREYLNNLLSLASFLSAAPFIENLEIHFVVVALPDCSELIRRLPRTTHNYLKNLSITGFAGCTGQVELLVHIVENAPNLEALTIDRVNCSRHDEEYERRSRSKALDIARKHLDGKTSQNLKVFML
ncbi:hypothetical protein U9M48_016513 [Paspalum notatum var. saurae]|uniref:At1g61320/AtMIF1 LRR domain-containing protein n=1 Tax=Paspalum notatum var. saurae TaxID=547442 RepID=A0AAQ3WMX1_PASNO